MKKILLLCVAAAITAVSCEELPNEQRLPINLSLGLQTKAAKTTFDDGDKVGIFVVSSDESLQNSGNHYDNIALTKGSDGWTPSQEMTWLDATTPETFYCYYPYKASVEDIHAYTFQVEDFSDWYNVEKNDFLWGKTNEIAPTTETIEIITSHLLSYATFDFSVEQILDIPVPDENSISFSLQNVLIRDIEKACYINLETGEVTPYDQNKGQLIISEGLHGEGIIIPQRVEDLTFEMEIIREYGGKTDTLNYTWETNSNFTFEAGKIHEFELTIQWPDDIDHTPNLSFKIKDWENGSDCSESVTLPSTK